MCLRSLRLLPTTSATSAKILRTASSLGMATHDDIWKLAEIGEEIPLETAFAPELAEITD